MLRHGIQVLYRNRFPAAVVAGVYAVLIWRDTTCLFRTIFHIPCPGCGMTHALLAALRLDWAEAWSCHPMFWSLPLLGVAVLCNGRLTKYSAVNILLLAGIAGGFAAAYWHRLCLYFGI